MRKLDFHLLVLPVLFVWLLAAGCDSEPVNPTAPAESSETSTIVPADTPTPTVTPESTPTPTPTETPTATPIPTLTPTPAPTATPTPPPTATPPPTPTPEPIVITLTGNGQDVRVIDNVPAGVYSVSMRFENDRDRHFSVLFEGVESGRERLANEVATEWSGTGLLRVGDGILDIPPGTILVSVEAAGGTTWEIVITEI